MLGKFDKQSAFDILDYFNEHGGNFIDTANNYQDEQSEMWIGEWLESRGVRDEMVISTKYSNGYLRYKRGVSQSSFTGNSTKSMVMSVEASLKKLRTSYIDIFYVHWWDFTTSVPEVMQSLNQLVVSGKVLYLGISDTPAWVVSKANECLYPRLLFTVKEILSRMLPRRSPERFSPIQCLPRVLELCGPRF